MFRGQSFKDLNEDEAQMINGPHSRDQLFSLPLSEYQEVLEKREGAERVLALVRVVLVSKSPGEPSPSSPGTAAGRRMRRAVGGMGTLAPGGPAAPRRLWTCACR